MGPLAVRRMVARHRRRLTGTALALVVACAIAMHHSSVSVAGHHDGAPAAIEMCLGAFVAVGATVVALLLGFVLLGRRTGSSRALGPAYVPARRSRPAVRAGPDLLRRCCVLRL